MKILVLGYSGAGKSTFAKKLQLHYEIPLLYLDTIHFEANWVERSDENMENDMKRFMSHNESWIIEGNYRKVCKDRYDLADQIFIFKRQRLVCLYGVVKRRIKHHKTPRESIATGCKEKLDLSFLLWVLFTGRTRKRRAYFDLIEKKYSNKVKIFKYKHQIKRYLKDIK